MTVGAPEERSQETSLITPIKPIAAHSKLPNPSMVEIIQRREETLGLRRIWRKIDTELQNIHGQEISLPSPAERIMNDLEDIPIMGRIGYRSSRLDPLS
jgi:hypothetical protein